MPSLCCGDCLTFVLDGRTFTGRSAGLLSRAATSSKRYPTDLEAPFSLLGQHKSASGFFDQSPADKAVERFGGKGVSRVPDLHLLQGLNLCVCHHII